MSQDFNSTLIVFGLLLYKGMKTHTYTHTHTQYSCCLSSGAYAQRANLIPWPSSKKSMTTASTPKVGFLLHHTYTHTHTT